MRGGVRKGYTTRPQNSLLASSTSITFFLPTCTHFGDGLPPWHFLERSLSLEVRFESDLKPMSSSLSSHPPSIPTSWSTIHLA